LVYIMSIFESSHSTLTFSCKLTCTVYHISKRQQAEFKRTVTVGNRLEAEHNLALLWPAMQVVKR
jgi:hypothetical protein